MTMEIRLAWYPAGDLGRAKEFYGKVLGLKKVFEMEGWAEFGPAEGAPAIGVSANPLHQSQKGATVVLKVDNLDRARTRLESKGVEFDGPNDEIPGIVRLATFRDPFGNPLQLVEELVNQG